RWPTHVNRTPSSWPSLSASPRWGQRSSQARMRPSRFTNNTRRPATLTPTISPLHRSLKLATRSNGIGLCSSDVEALERFDPDVCQRAARIQPPPAVPDAHRALSRDAHLGRLTELVGKRRDGFVFFREDHQSQCVTLQKPIQRQHASTLGRQPP